MVVVPAGDSDTRALRCRRATLYDRRSREDLPIIFCRRTATIIADTGRLESREAANSPGGHRQDTRLPSHPPVSFTLSMSGVIVGRTDLESRDPTRRVVQGRFRPGLGYELAQPVFELYATARDDPASLERYRRARESLQLALTDVGGARVSFRELHIQRTATTSPGSTQYVIEIESDDPSLWNVAPKD